MFRAIDPKAQADLIDGYVVEQGGRPKRTRTMEVVAKINGAPNWNAMQNPRKHRGPGIKDALVAALTPASQAVNMSMSFVDELDDTLLNVIFAGLPERASEEDLLIAVHEKLGSLRPALERLHHDAVMARGHCRIARAVPAGGRVRLFVQMYSEDETWSLVNPRTEASGNCEDIELPDELLREMRETGVVLEAEVQYPRADRFGVPDETTDKGFTQYIWGEGFQVAQSLAVFGEDSGDDSSATCTINLALTEAVHEKVKALLG